LYMFYITISKLTFFFGFAFNIKTHFMIKNYISFQNLIAQIRECSKRMTILRHEMGMQEESGIDSEQQKRELINLSNELSLLRSKLDFLRGKEKSLRSINF